MEAHTLESVGTRRREHWPRGAAPSGEPRIGKKRLIAGALIGTWKHGLGYLRRQRGTVGLIEVLTAAPIMIATLGAVLSLNYTSFNEHDRVESRARAGTDQRIALARMTREIRQATKVLDSSTAQVLDFERWVSPADGGDPVPLLVRYDCSAGTCMRSQGPPGQGVAGLGTPVTVIDGVRVQNANVFTRYPATYEDPPDSGIFPFEQYPRRVEVKLAVTIKHELCPEEQGTGCRTPNPTNPLVLEEGVELRNTRPEADEGLNACDEVPEPPECNVST